MTRVGLISDTHGYLDERIIHHLSSCDEIWHAGDIGTLEVLDNLSEIKPLRAVYGNVDDHQIRINCSENLIFNCEEVKVWITHIGGYPPNYTSKVKEVLDKEKPGIFICGHSHILRVIPDKSRNLIHINPGACGKHGFHHVRTMVKFEIDGKEINNLQVIELEPRR